MIMISMGRFPVHFCCSTSISIHLNMAIQKGNSTIMTRLLSEPNLGVDAVDELEKWVDLFLR